MDSDMKSLYHKPKAVDNGQLCRECGQVNEIRARFCASCGLNIPRSGANSSGLSIRFALLGGGVSVAFMFLLFGVGSLAFNKNDRTAPIKVETKRTYRLHNAKATALVDLLSPRDVPVIVGRRGHNVGIQGTTIQIRTMDRFVELLLRHEKHCYAQHPKCFETYHNKWTSKVDYKLGKKHAKALFEILAFNDVPVLVTQHGSRLLVRATPNDQKTVSEVARILNGR